MKLKNLILPASILLTLPAQAAITYVDATVGPGGNTRQTGFPQDNTDWVIATGSPDPDHWSQRTLNGTNGNILQALPTGSSTAIPRLTTTISDLTDGNTYRVWAFFQDNVGDDSSPFQNWVLAAGLDPNLDTTYWAPNQPLNAHNLATPVLGATGTGAITTSGVTEASDLTFLGTPPLLSEGSGTGERRLYAVNLGDVTLSGGTEIDVYVGMLIEGSSGATRTWYDGVGYEVIPEPSVALLSGLGVVALLRRRRN